jgi:hypothetical protein
LQRADGHLMAAPPSATPKALFCKPLRLVPLARVIATVKRLGVSGGHPFTVDAWWWPLGYASRQHFYEDCRRRVPQTQSRVVRAKSQGRGRPSKSIEMSYRGFRHLMLGRRRKGGALGENCAVLCAALSTLPDWLTLQDRATTQK